ncbi:MAG: conjugal transfer protein TraX [Lachnospiraceae bacterium]|nr:conjugal transfer protein TraX [Lachnospiraceae bacterium]
MKIIACISMFIDHFTLIMWHRYRAYISTLDYDSIIRYQKLYNAGRAIGRLAFPIFCFLLVEGFFHTKSLLKYLGRLFILALASEHAFNLLVSSQNFDRENQNVYFTLFLALSAIAIIDKIARRFKESPDIRSILTILTAAAFCGLAYILKTDYDYKGVIAVIVIYMLRNSRILTCIGTVLCFLWEPWASPVALPLLLYNGKRGLKLKYIFYIFYPLHIYFAYYLAFHILK